MGGSVASYYITGFASYELLHLAPYWLAFAFMVAVTLLAFALPSGKTDRYCLLSARRARSRHPLYCRQLPRNSRAGIIHRTCAGRYKRNLPGSGLALSAVDGLCRRLVGTVHSLLGSIRFQFICKSVRTGGFSRQA